MTVYFDKTVVIAGDNAGDNPVRKRTIELGDNVLHDSEYVKAFSASSSILDDVKAHCRFDESALYVREILQNFTNHKGSLHSRQMFFSNLDDARIDSVLRKVPPLIESAKWFLSQKDEEIQNVLKSVFFKWRLFRGLNNFEIPLQLKQFYSIFVSPTIGVLSPVIYFTLPLVIMRMKYGIKIPIKYYTQTLFTLSTASIQQSDSSMLRNMTVLSYASSVFFYGQGCYNSITSSKSTSDICKLLVKHTKNVFELCDISNDLMNVLRTNPYYNLDAIDEVWCESHVRESHVRESHVRANFTGSYLKHFLRFDTNRKISIHHALNVVHVADAFRAIHSFIRSNNLCKASFDFDCEIPRYKFVNSWHVSLNPSKAVKNTICNSNTKRNCIITGANATGKTTFIKSALVNVLLSQSITFCAAEQVSLTPFDYIGSQISIPDCKGKESLFEAEMHRSKANLHYVRSHPHSKCILFLDEIFNSTNPVEGISGSHSVIRNIGKCKNVAVFLTTHYDYICNLNEGRYSLYKFDCTVQEKEIIYNYKIKEGISKQFIALDILRLNGFDEDVIADAQKIKDLLLRSSVVQRRR